MTKPGLKMTQVIFELSLGDRELLRIIASDHESTQVDLIRGWIRAAARELLDPFAEQYLAQHRSEQEAISAERIKEIEAQEKALQLEKASYYLASEEKVAAEVAR